MLEESKPENTSESKVPTAQNHYDKADELFDQNDNEGAITECTKAIELDPSFAGAYRLRGRVRSWLSDHDGAIDDYSKAIELDPNNASHYMSRALLNVMRIFTTDGGYRYLGKTDTFEMAISDLSEAIRLEPDDASAFAISGDQYLSKAKWFCKTGHLSMGDLESAFSDYNKAIRLALEWTMAYSGRGMVHYMRGGLCPRRCG